MAVENIAGVSNLSESRGSIEWHQLHEMLRFTRDYEGAPLATTISSAIELIAGWLGADYVCLHFNKLDELDDVVAAASLRLCAGRLVSNVTSLEHDLVASARNSQSRIDQTSAGPIKRAFALPLRYGGETYAVVNAYYVSDKGRPRQVTLDAVAHLGHYIFAGIKRRIVDRDGYEYGNIVSMLASLIESRGAASSGHGDRVMHLAEKLALAVGVNGDELRVTRRAALLHDIGKVGVPDRILGKPGPLDESERTAVMLHTAIGERVLAALHGAHMRSVAQAVGAHHERVDGKGYPRGLRGNEIPEAARIIAICEAYDAMVSGGPHRPPMSRAAALAELAANAGTQFDAGLVEMFARQRCWEPEPLFAKSHRDEL